jgi:hypothetical protein
MPFYKDTWKKAEETLGSGRSRAFQPTADSELFLWVSPDGSRHCLIPCGPEFPEQRERVANALAVETTQIELEGRGRARHLDIHCLDSSLHHLFDYLIHDLDAGSDVLLDLDQKLEQYRHFWGPSSRTFTYKEAAGLFGEVLFMDAWLGSDPVHGFGAWTGGDPLLYDFSWSRATVEVKTTLAGLPATHSIGTIEQLAGQDERPLFLFSVALRQDRGAGTFLGDLLDKYRATLTPFGLESKFNRRVLERGYRPDDPENGKYRYVLLNGEGSLYEVRDRFPRLVAESFVSAKLPDGVGGVSYEISLAGCEEYRSELQPGFDARSEFGDPDVGGNAG